MITYHYKIILLGDSCVGKTTIFNQLLDVPFDPRYSTTIGVDYGSIHLNIMNNIRLKLKIWDTAGQERFNSIIKSYYKCAQIAIFVYDTTSQISLDNINKWIENYLSNSNPNQDIQLMYLIGNKKDKVFNNEKIDLNIINNLINKYKMKHYEICAKNKLNVEDVFNNIANDIYTSTYVLIKNNILNIHVEYSSDEKPINLLNPISNPNSKPNSKPKPNKKCCY